MRPFVKILRPLLENITALRGHCRVGHFIFRFGLSKGTRSSAIAEGLRDASCQLKSCQLPSNSAETAYTTSPDQIDGMKLEI